MEDKEIVKNCLYELEEKLLQSGKNQFSPETPDLLSEDFIEFGSSGSIYNKKQVIEYLLQDSKRKITIKNFEIRILTGDVVLVTYQAEKCNNKEEWIRSLRSSLWKFSDNRWQIIFHQGTPFNSCF